MPSSVTLKGLELGSSPLPGERWRIVVANVSRLAPLQELLTFGWASTATHEKAQAWFDSVASLGLGYPASQPIAEGELFCLDMKFSTTQGGLLPLSAIVQRWEQLTPATQVVYVARVPANESAAEGVSGRSSAIVEAGRALRQSSTATKLLSAGRTAVTTLQLLFGAVIVGGAWYLISRAKR